MSKNLVLVESPSKAKTINKYLGKDYHVEATIGHIRDLPKTKFGVDLEDNFKPQLLNIRGKGDIIKKIKSLAQKSKNIYIATDPDREGEAIAQDIVDIVNGSNQNSVHRVLFNEITKNAVLKAIKAPLNIDTHLVLSQRARRVMDRIIGYKISPILWKAVFDPSNFSLSAGRVQSVALRLICEREQDIENFVATEYWAIWAELRTDKNETFTAKLTEIDGKTIKLKSDESFSLQKNIAISDGSTADELVKRVREKNLFIISDVNKKEGKRNPPPPFITSTLQSEASKTLRFRPRQTMEIAQNLYEGIDLGNEGTVGLITYMRTDSFRISPDLITEVRDYIKDTYGASYLPEAARSFDKKNGSNVQDAHEAIRPTSIKYTPEFVKPFLDKKQFKLYELIWKRFVASQMNSAVIETTTVEVKADEFLFKASGTAVKFDGFQQIYDEQKEDAVDKDESENDRIPLGLEKDQVVGLIDVHETQHFTKPPARFSESSLIKELESNGIGRPSTYAQIVSTIQDRKYVVNEDRRIKPTTLGRKVNDILVSSFPEVLNVNFTAKMEGELDSIAQGEINYEEVLNDFYGPFSKALEKVEENVEKIYCENCGSEMELKIGRFGKYFACTNYPECKTIKSLKDLQPESSREPEFTGEKCEKCGSNTVFRVGKFGKFIGCEKYPECDFIKPISLGISCPKCKEGNVIERRSRRGRAFFGCSRYPDCDFVSWYQPIAQQCPNKDSEIMEKRYNAKKGEFLKCPVCGEELILEEKES